MPSLDWYKRRHELEPEMVFKTDAGWVKLDRSVPGDGTRWYVATWYPGVNCTNVDPIYHVGHWSYDDNTIEPNDLKGNPQCEDPIN